MAILLLANGTVRRDLSTITRVLASLDVTLNRYTPKVPSRSSNLLPALLAKDVLAEADKHHILALHNQQIDSFGEEREQLWSDLLSLHPGSPDLHLFIATNGCYHIHAEPESLDVLMGEAMFGFFRPDGSHIKLLLQPHEYIHIPAGVEHWLSPTATLEVKAVRYFTTVEGWVPQYTGTELHDPHDRLRFSW